MTFQFFGVTTAKDWSVKSWNVGSVTDFSYMFASWVGQHDIGLGEWDVKNGKYMDYMFAEASSNVPINFRRWNTGNARSMEGMVSFNLQCHMGKNFTHDPTLVCPVEQRDR